MPYNIELHPPCEIGKEREYVSEAIARGDWARGEYISRFERMVADYVGVSHAVATCNGSAALHLAVMAAMGDTEGQVSFYMPGLCFIAPVNAVQIYPPDVAQVRLVDVDLDTWQMMSLESNLRENETSILLQVHNYGGIAPFEPPGLYYAAIRDASESLGASIHGMRCGEVSGDDIAVLSFNGNKLVSTGGGGMLLTDNESIAEYCRWVSHHARDSNYSYAHSEVGHNFHMPNVNAALGVAQMEHIFDLVQRHREVGLRYDQAFADNPELIPMRYEEGVKPTYWLYSLRTETNQKRDALGYFLQTLQIETRPAFGAIKDSRTDSLFDDPLLNSQTIAECGISLPSGAALSKDDQEKVIEAVLAWAG